MDQHRLNRVFLASAVRGRRGKSEVYGLSQGKFTADQLVHEIMHDTPAGSTFLKAFEQAAAVEGCDTRDVIRLYVGNPTLGMK